MKKKVNYIGEKTILKNTLECEIIGICKDKRYVIIRFEDGTVLEHVNIAQFKSKQIRHPHIENVNMLGKKKHMRCGKQCEIIKDEGEYISVKFENGEVIDNCSKKSFINGHLSYYRDCKKTITGHSRKMLNGMMCEVIADYGYKNITVQFEDGTILEKRRRDSFFLGRISNPNYDPNSIVGKIKMMNCGMQCKVIEDFGNKNITVEFEDGTIIKNRTRHNFEKGKIANPSIANSSLPQAIIYYLIHNYFPDTINNYRPSWLRSKLSSFNLEIDIWIPSKNVGIEYDGYQWHKTETDNAREKEQLIAKATEIKQLFTILERGAVAHTSAKHINYQLDYQSDYYEYADLFKQLEIVINDILRRLGVIETIIIDDELIDRLYCDVDVVEFRRVVNDNLDGLHRLFKNRIITGQRAIMNCGMECEVIEDLGYDNITVRFEDGTVIENKTRQSFRSRTINNPNFSRYDITGEKAIMKNGMKAEVIKDNGAYDITVQFSDGTIVKSVRSSWKKRLIKNPNINKGTMVGKTRTMNCGMICTVIEDNGPNHISVQFEDGTIIRKRTRQEFKKGCINNPKIVRNSILGQEARMKCGMSCTVIEDNGSKDISVRFEDGYEKHHIERATFRNKLISNPNLKKTLLGQKKAMNCGMECTVISDNGYKDITVQFSDGTVLTKQRRDTFRNGNIKNPNYNSTSIVGQERKMNCGLMCKVIEDFGSENITVMFENGIIREKCSRHNFKKGKIAAKALSD